MVYKEYKHVDLCSKLREWRIDMDIPVATISLCTGYTRANVYNFENGQNNNMDLLVWYLMNGFDIKRYFREVE